MSDHLYEFGEFQLNPAERVILRNGEIVPLTPKAIQTLIVLVRRSGQVVSKDELIETVWKDTFVEENTLTRNISALRKTLGHSRDGQSFIKTIPKVGYQFVAPVKEVERQALGFGKVGKTGRASKKTAKFAAVAFVALLGALVTLGFWYYKRDAAGYTRIRSIAVMPFENANGDTETEYLSDGITENIINRLSQLPDLKVTSRSSVFQYKGKGIDAQKVGRELGVQAVILGRILQRGDKLSVSLEMVATHDNSHFWGEQYHSELKDLIALQREIPMEIAETLRLKLSGTDRDRLTKRYTDNIDAYKYYLKGLYTLQKWTRPDARQAVEYFQQAINIDPNYALAYSGMADAYNWGTGSSREEEVLKGKTAMRRALEIDENLGEAHSTFADYLMHYEWDLKGAGLAFKRSLELSPGFAEGRHRYAHYLANVGNADEALKESVRYLELDPVSPSPKLHLGWQYLQRRQYDQAIEQYTQIFEQDPNYTQAHRQIGDAFYFKGMYDEAVEAYLRAFALQKSKPENIDALRKAYRTSGIKKYLHEHIRILKDARSEAELYSNNAYQIAANYALLGETELAFEWLERAFSDRSPLMVELKTALYFENISSDARYTTLSRRVGLPD